MQVSTFLKASILFTSITYATAQLPIKTGHAVSSAEYGRLPLSFEANRGQADPSVQFLAHGQGYTLFLQQGEAALTLRSAASPSQAGGETSLLRLQLVGAHRDSAIRSEDQQITRTNYFFGSDPAKWRTDIPNYGRVRYIGIYEGIDLVYYGSQYGSQHGDQRRLEHDFIVAPNADPGEIKLAMKGARKVRIDAATGDLILNTGKGSSQLRLLKPVTYQQFNGRRTEVISDYKLLAGNRIGFSLGRYNHAETLVIDPILVYSTYLGGSGALSADQFYQIEGTGNGDQGNGIAVDASGNAYIVGTTYSTDFPLTTGAFQSQNNAPAFSSTVFVSKLNPAGTALVYSTYLGGSGGDMGYGIALDGAGNAYVTGATYSIDFPVTCGALLTTNPSKTSGASTGFVAKLNTTGTALDYSTYLGGSGNQATPAQGDVSQAIAVDGEGNAYLTGYTWSSDFPTTAKTFQQEFAGNSTVSNAFVTKLNSTGTALAYSTYLGGSGSSGSGDVGNAIAVDSSGDAYVAGNTDSVNFPVTPTAFQTANHFVSVPFGFYTGTAFVTKLNPAGSAETYSTYLGGSGGDLATAIAIDNAGYAYVAGNTGSADFPVTAGVVEGSSYGANAAYLNGFVTKINPDGAGLAYSTHIEGRAITLSGLAIDSSGAAYLAGSAPATYNGNFAGFQPTPDALPAVATATGNSAFVVKLSPDASAMNYATLLGGSMNDAALAIATDPGKNVYLTGYAYSSDFPTTQPSGNPNGFNGASGFVSKFALGVEANQTTYPAVPSQEGTFLVVNSQYWASLSLCGISPATQLFVEATAYANLVGGPAINGYMGLIGNFGSSQGDFIEGFLPQNSGLGEPTAGGVTSGEYTVAFSDPVWGNASLSGNAPLEPCPPLPPGAPAAASVRASAAPGNPSSGGAVHVNLSQPIPMASPAKFTPVPIVPNASGRSLRASVQANSTSGCLAPPTLLPLTVTIRSAARLYGAANPGFVYSISGLLSGDVVTVTPSTTATVLSPVGMYPVTALIGGADAGKYAIQIDPGTLTILKAPLYISAANVSITYGQTPQLAAYHLYGFVNGDTVSVVSGAPLLTTTVTATTPAGTYPIGIQAGTLSAANYYFDTFSNGEGTVQVYRAVLYIQAKNVAVTYGQAPPANLPYDFVGFVNGENASVLSGAPLLTTTVTSTTPVGFYRIGVQVGTLSSPNYLFRTTFNGMGSVGVYKAPLQLIANNANMTQGGAVPSLTYMMSGFVNGQGIGIVTGTPNLSTTATSISRAGKYPITITQGTLAAPNYFFENVPGVLTVVP
jgi:hypothetical protein